MLRCLVLEDDPNTLEILEKYIRSIYFLDCRGLFTDTRAADQSLKSEAVDIVFMSASMDGDNRMLFLKALRKQTAIIFTGVMPAGFKDHVGAAALNQIPNPITYYHFLKAIIRARQWIDEMTT